MTGMTHPAPKLTGEANVSNISFVLRKIAETPAGICEEQLATISRLLRPGSRMCAPGTGSSRKDLIGPQQHGSTG
ncbi:hypothetical protein V1639_08380 [Pseudarthrobacter sp. J75]|uniref:hypothetical protein n=1 Tax=unclassified Pseudarthrobacter TaxID=2647000 RepID=UPI002E80C41A|nr:MULTISPECIES: hypothetical protein [unclassified Pseudarthrobacter]MEE2522121.1 hypothetical protein [Pseudarthrobacter sp. J47]MEE2529046.1 hypothetical protein [Pseudarthrobacter sp. J75]MEE2570621.1 hypothetical protein [Pseudarthrobacter sp. J64]